MVGWTKTESGVENQGDLRNTRKGWTSETEEEQHFEERGYWVEWRKRRQIDDISDSSGRGKSKWGRSVCCFSCFWGRSNYLCITVTAYYMKGCFTAWFRHFQEPLLEDTDEYIKQLCLTHLSECTGKEDPALKYLRMLKLKFLFPAHTVSPFSPFSSKCHLFLWLMRGGGG